MNWVSFLRDKAIEHPSKVALIDDDNNKKWTYKELFEESTMCAGLMMSNGVVNGDNIAILAKNRVEHLTLLFACSYIGATLVPMNFRLSHQEIVEILDKVNARLIFHEDEICDYENAKRINILSEDFTKKPKLTDGQIEDIANFANNDSDPSLMLFSSGTTGQPKGILLHGQMIGCNQEMTNSSWGLKEDDVTIINTPFFHTGGYNVLCLPLLKLGGTVILKRDFCPFETLDLIKKYSVSVYFAVPSMFEMMASEDSFDRADLSSVRFFVSGGAHCSVELIKKYQRKEISFKQGFGLSEVGPNCFLLHEDDAIAKVGSIGKPMSHTSVLLVNEEGKEVDQGEIGELLLAGDHVCCGYYNDTELFSSSFQGAYFKTGDLARMDEDGFFYIVGRKKEMYISGGENVYPAEVEKKVVQHPDIDQCFVVSINDDKWGEVGVSYIKSSKKVAMSELREFLNPVLSRYKHPQYIINVERLPYLANGKVDKVQLKKTAADIIEPSCGPTIKREYESSHF